MIFRGKRALFSRGVARGNWATECVLVIGTVFGFEGSRSDSLS